MSSRTNKNGTNEKKMPSSSAGLDIILTVPRRGRFHLVTRGRAAIVIATAIAGLLAALATSCDHGAHAPANAASAPAPAASAK